MNARAALRALGIALIVAGAVLLGLAIMDGELSVAIVVIVPVFYGAGPLAALAVLTLFAGIAALFFSAAAPMPEESTGGKEVRGEREMGGVVLIGPIPIVFGSGKALRGSWVLVALSVLSLFLLLMFLIAVLR